MKRIEPKKVAKFFATHRDIKPLDGGWIKMSEQGNVAGCCGALALCMNSDGLPAFPLNDLPGSVQDGAIWIAPKLGLPWRYLFGFVNGWDHWGSPGGVPEFKRGYRAGLKAYILTQEALR